MTIPEIVRRHSQPLQPLPTDIKVHADPIPGIRAVLFDVYGTLLISASGDIDQSAGSNPGAAALEALAAVNVTPSGTGGAAGDTGKTVVDRLRHAIRQRHEASPWANPEIDIRDVWTDVLDELTADGYLVAEAGRDADVARLAVEYEVRVNPVWTMPQLVRCLTAIRQGGQHWELSAMRNSSPSNYFRPCWARTFYSWGLMRDSASGRSNTDRPNRGRFYLNRRRSR